MLKVVLLDEKPVPVPVPIKELAQAIRWVEETLVPTHATVTKITLDGDDATELCERGRNPQLTPDSRLAFTIESPIELALKTLGAVHDLTSAIESRLQEIAVACWQLTTESQFASVRSTADDLQLIIHLVEHLNGIMDHRHKEMAPVNGLARLIARPLGDLNTAITATEWKTCARILLNRIEPWMRELVAECENLQISVLASRTQGTIAEATSG